MPSDQLDPNELLQVSRDHWKIGSCLFHVRDVTFAEDASRVRTGEAPKVMAELRKATLTPIRQSGQRPRPARETHAARPRASIKRVLHHWKIESCLFQVRDVTFEEDASRIRTGKAPKVMAELRKATLTPIRQSGQKPRPARETHAARPRAAIKRVLTS